MSARPPWLDPLDDALAAQAGPEARYAQLATVRPDGRPANRTIVVRGRLAPSRFLVTTDARSAKVGDLDRSPWAELCWYFPATREQFRLLGRVTIVGPDNTDADLASTRLRVWNELPEPSRRSFTWPVPGAPRSRPGGFADGTPAEPPASFILLVLDPERVERLELRGTPHERTVYRRAEGYWVEERVNP